MHQRSIPRSVAVPLIVLAIAAGLRLWGLASPDQPYGDEPYYAFDAAAYLGGGTVGPIGADPPAVRIADEGTWVHPPLGKWIIALLGVGPIGQRSIGWRVPSAVFGIAGVGLLYLLALRLWRSVWWAGLAALLLALDGLHIVQSRMAMLDIFVTTFVTAAVLFLVLDRERMETRRSVAGGLGSSGSSARRIACGRVSSWDVRWPRNGRARSRCRSSEASARSGYSPDIGEAIARCSPRVRRS